VSLNRCFCCSSIFLRRGGAEDNFVKLRGGAGKLSVSHDSVFPGEVPHTRPLASLASLATLEVSSCSLIQMSQTIPLERLRAAFSVFLEGPVTDARGLFKSPLETHGNPFGRYLAQDFSNTHEMKEATLYMPFRASK